MRTEYLDYQDGETACEAYAAYDEAAERRPAVLVAHSWAGQSDAERATAEKLAGLGYVGIAVDVYGKGVRGGPNSDNGALMAPFMADRGLVRSRMLAAVEAARSHPRVDPERVAAIGYCFGGLCVLDLARSGTELVRGVVSLHGVFAPLGPGEPAPIKAKVLALHGWADPLAPPAAAAALGDELTRAGADWQLHAYGHAMHAFTQPQANAPERGLAYNEAAARRAWSSTLTFLNETLA